MSRAILVAALVALVALLLLVAVTPAAATWRRPVGGEVARAFSYDERTPFAAGARRGIDLAAPPGARVRSACTGRVSFAGRLPGGGRGVSVRCGVLTATYLHLAATRVRRGRRVLAGTALGDVDASGVLRLGARVTARRFGYVDPERLLGGDSPPIPLPAPVAPRSRPTPRAPLRAPQAPSPRAERAPVPRPVPSRRAERVPPPRAERVPTRHSPRPRVAGLPSRRLPIAVALGAALLAAGIGTGGLVRRRTRRGHVAAEGGWRGVRCFRRTATERGHTP